MNRSWTTRAVLLGALAGLAAGCQDTPPANEFFAFVRPQHLAFACYDTQNRGFGPNLTQSVERPLACCGVGSARDDSDHCGTSPRLHGLVSQTRRGEVAAVNLEPEDGEESVVDSDPTIPGFTFTDVGELPSALVIPKVDLVNEGCGPRWAFVASAGDREVRAVATCRFRRGVSCGPELALNAAGADFAELTRIPLGSEPGDMVLDENGYLWISLPEQDALGRIRINDGSAIVEGGGSLDAPGCEVAGESLPSPSNDADMIAMQRPFLAGGDGSVLELFPLDDTLPTVALTTVDDDGYRAQCGLGVREDTLGDRVVEPYTSELLTDGGLDGGLDAGADAGLDAGLDAGADGGADAGLGAAATRVSPKRLRYDSRTGLLLASDLARPLLHAWDIRGETPTPVASIVTGAPVRDFVVTGPVPASVDLYVRDGSSVEPNDAFSDDQVRYIYAIDDRDGSVLAIRWTPDAGGQDTVELVRPRGRVPKADRLYVGNGLAQTLEVIDTRTNSLGACGNPDAEDYDRGETIRDLLPGSILRGVFVAVALSTGDLVILDVHDQDLFCEAFGYSIEGADGGTQRVPGRCDPSNPVSPNTAQLRSDGNDRDPIGLSVRRHSIRLEQAEPPDGRGDTDDLGAIVCPDGYLVLDQESERGGVLTSGRSGVPPANVNTFCINQDPGMQLLQDWVVTYEGLLPIPTGAEGYFEPESLEEGRARFQLTPGFDLCTRGVADADALDEEQAYAGDFLVLPRTPPAGAPAGCELEPQEDEPRFPIVEAYDDHVIVGARLDSDADRMSLQRAIQCYGPNTASDSTASGISTFNVSVRGRHLVTGSGLGVLSRMTSDGDSGRCVLDPERDPRLRSRVKVASDDAQCDAAPYLFQNPYVAFCPRRLSEGSAESSYGLTVDVFRAPSPLVRSLTGGLASPVLPATIRYQAETRQLFVVDSAEQGLLRWDIRPLPRTRTESYR